MNSIQERKILEFVQGQEKDIDAINQHINDIIVLSGLTNKEVAALLFTLMRNTLAGGNNVELLKRMNIKDVSALGVTGVLEIQKLWVNEYSKGLSAKGKPYKAPTPNKPNKKSIKKRVKK